MGQDSQNTAKYLIKYDGKAILFIISRTPAQVSTMKKKNPTKKKTIQRIRYKQSSLMKKLIISTQSNNLAYQ